MLELHKLLASCLYEIEHCDDLKKIGDVKSSILGKNGLITAQMKLLKNLPPEKKKDFGQKINEIKETVQKKLNEQIEYLKITEIEQTLSTEAVDISMPVRPMRFGKIHPISKVMEELGEIMQSYGFMCAEGPDIDSEYYNFTSVNIPEHHPARTMQDTFYLSEPADDFGRKLLRTQTSAVQNRVMTANKPPLRFFSMGRVFRSDYDATHTPMFNQIEGIVVEKGISFSHLKWLLSDILKKFFDISELSIRLRPSFFPFTEPSAEVDIGYEERNGKIVICKSNNWLEVCGCGMIHPNVLTLGGIDPKEFSGFAFGFGIERLASLKYGIPDLRGYFESDNRWRDTFGFDLCDK